MQNFELPDIIINVIKQLTDAGYEAYIVGGAVRSHLLNRPIHDYDLTTNATPDQMKQVFSNYPILLHGEKHGTITVLVDHEPIEITTFRHDGTYENHRHPDTVSFTTSLKEDCKRRDFTMNAISYSPTTGYHDFYHGIEDIQNKLIRTVREPKKRFTEDALRILRAIRFASQLGFTIEQNTKDAIFHLKTDLNYIAKERLQSELNKLLEGHYCPEIITEYLPVIQILIPELNTIDSTALANAPEDYVVRLAILLKTYDYKTVLKRLKYSNDVIQTITDLIETTGAIDSKIAIKHILSQLTIPFERYLSYVCAIHPETNKTGIMQTYNEIMTKGECYSLKQLAISGTDLKKAGYQGKEIATQLNHILNLVIDETIPNDYETIMKTVQK